MYILAKQLWIGGFVARTNQGFVLVCGTVPIIIRSLFIFPFIYIHFSLPLIFTFFFVFCCKSSLFYIPIKQYLKHVVVDTFMSF